MIRPNGRVRCSRPLNEIWADTQPGIHPVGTCEANPIEDPDSYPVVTDPPRRERAAPAELAWRAALRPLVE
jgi:hypothetical protein